VGNYRIDDERVVVIAVARSDIPGFAGITFEGGSPAARASAGLAPWCDDPVFSATGICAPDTISIKGRYDVVNGVLKGLNEGGAHFYNIEQSLQDQWAKLQQTNPGAKIKFKVELHYSDTAGDAITEVPNEIKVSYSIDGGDWIGDEFPNTKQP